MKFKKLLLLLVIVMPGAAFALPNPEGCHVSQDERLICANVMCDFGSIMGEWSDECTQYKKDLAIYLAKLQPWEKPPKCTKRDQNCKKVGKATKAPADQKFCMTLKTVQEQDACLNGIKKIADDPEDTDPQ